MFLKINLPQETRQWDKQLHRQTKNYTDKLKIEQLEYH
jgi:hypothetical protein